MSCRYITLWNIASFWHNSQRPGFFLRHPLCVYTYCNIDIYRVAQNRQKLNMQVTELSESGFSFWLHHFYKTKQVNNDVSNVITLSNTMWHFLYYASLKELFMWVITTLYEYKSTWWVLCVSSTILTICATYICSTTCSTLRPQAHQHSCSLFQQLSARRRQNVLVR